MLSRWRTTACFAAITLVIACNAFRSLDECAKDTDCPRSVKCGSEKFCHVGGPIQLGAIVPLSGSQAARGQIRKNGLEFGVWMLSRDPSLKILGRGVELRAVDNISAVENVPTRAREILGGNVAAFFGPLTSAEVLEAQKQTGPARTLHVAPGVGADALGNAQGEFPDRYLFQLSTDIRNGTIRSLPLFLADEHPVELDRCFDGVAIVVIDDATGSSYESALGDLFTNNCIPVTAKLRVPREKKASYQAEVDTLLAAKNDKGVATQCAVLSMFAPAAGELLRSLAAASAAVPTRGKYSALFGTSLLNDPTLFAEAKSAVAGQPSLAEGLHGIDFDPLPPRVEYRDIQALWAEYVRTRDDLREEDFIADHALWAEAVVTTGLAMELAGRTDDPRRVRDAFVDLMQPGPDDVAFGPKEMFTIIRSIRDARKDGRHVALDYRGAISDYDFDARGFVDTNAFVYKATNGNFERVVGYAPAQLKRAWESPGPACKR